MEFKTIKPKDDALIVRHNKLIEARYETTLHQQRIMLWLISEIRPEDREFQKYRVTIKELARFIGIEKNKNIYHELAIATKGMVGCVIEIGEIGEGRLLQMGLIRLVEYRYGEGFIDISVNPELLPYLIELKANFTTAYLRDLMAMRSVYSIRLYDLLNQYRKIGKRTLEVEEIKRIFKIEEKYTEYKNFKARVVVPAVKEIEARTDLLVSLIEKKTGRSVTALEFTIRTKKGFLITSEADEAQPKDTDLYRRLLSHGVKEKEAKKYLELYGESDPARISENLDKLEEGIEAGKVKNSSAWLRKAIDEDYRDQKSLFQINNEKAITEAKERKREREARAQQARAIEQQIELQEKAYVTYRQEFVESVITSIPVNELRIWEEEFSQTLEGFFKTEWMKRRDWKNRITVTKTEKFIAQKTGRLCASQEDFYKENGFEPVEALQRRREALL